MEKPSSIEIKYIIFPAFYLLLEDIVVIKCAIIIHNLYRIAIVIFDIKSEGKG